MVTKSLSDINKISAEFYSGLECGYISTDEVMDSFGPWKNPYLEDNDVEGDISFIDSLHELYDVYGPLEYKGDTLNQYVPVDAEVGDDHIKFCDAPMTFLAELVSAEKFFSAKISAKDTFISSRYGNYSESFILKPDSHSELYSGAAHSTEDTVFLDIAKIRTVISVCSMRQKHSDTVSGKVSLLGKQAVYDTVFCSREVQIAQTLQMLCLGLNKEKKFPYIPTHLGGFSSPPIFKNYKSMVRSFYTWKSGKYFDLLAAITCAVHDMDRGVQGHPAQFLSHIKGEAESWQDWYKVYTKYVPTVKTNISPALRSAFYVGTFGQSEVWDSAANRLLSAEVLISESQLAVHDHVEDLTCILLSSENSLETRELIEEEKKSQRLQSPFNPKLQKEILGCVPMILSEEMVDSLLSLSIGGSNLLKFLIRRENLFDRNALDFVKQLSPTKVNLGMTNNRGLRYPLNLEKYLDSDMEYELQTLYDFILDKRSIEEISRKLVSDDEILIEIARKWAVETNHYTMKTKIMVIHTDDVKLCKRVNHLLPQIVVMRVSVKKNQDQMRSIWTDIRRKYHEADIKYFKDEGSMDHFQNFSVEENGFRFKIIPRQRIDPFSNGIRKLIKVLQPRLLTKPDEVFDERGLLNKKFNDTRIHHKRRLGDLYEYRQEDELESDDQNTDLESSNPSFGREQN